MVARVKLKPKVARVKPSMLKEWDGRCVCGKSENDGVRCRFGASHRTVKRVPRWSNE